MFPFEMPSFSMDLPLDPTFESNLGSSLNFLFRLLMFNQCKLKAISGL